MLHGKQAGAFPDQQDMRCLFHDAPRQGGWMTNVFQRRHGSTRQRLSVHDTSVELDGTNGIRQPPVADRVHLGIILDRLGTGDGGVESRFALL